MNTRPQATSWNLITRYWHYLALITVVGLVFAPVFLGRGVFVRDAGRFTIPFRWFMREAILNGRLPGWDSSQGLGFPAVADPLLGLFYPPNWLYLLAHPAQVVSFDSLFHIVWGGIGIMVVLGRLGVGRSAALIGGIAWSLSGITTGMWTAGLLLQAMAWIPWLALAGLSLGQLARVKLRWSVAARTIALAALPTIGGLLQGEVFVTVMGLLAGFALALVVEWTHRGDIDSSVAPVSESENPPRFSLGRFLAKLALAELVALLLAITVAAVTLAPVLVSLGQTERTQPLMREDAEVWSFHPLRMIEMVAPESMGHPLLGYPGGRWVGDPQFRGDPLAFSVYLGAAALALALAALGRRRKLAVGVAALTLFALTVAMGRHLPIHAVVRRLIPPLGYMRFPEKYLVLVPVGVALLAGLGADRALMTTRRLWIGGLLWLVFMCTVAAIHGLFPQAISNLVLRGAIHASIFSGLLVAVIATTRGRFRVAAAVVIIAADLALPSWQTVEFSSTEVQMRRPPAGTYVLEHRRDRPVPPRVFSAPGTIDAVAQRTNATTADEYVSRQLLILLNAANVHGIASLPGYDAALPKSWSKLWHYGNHKSLANMLRLAAAEFAIFPTSPTDAPPSPTEFEPVMDPLPGARLYRVRDPLPRVFAVSHTEAAGPRETIRRVLEPDVVGGEVAMISTDDPGAHIDGPPGRAGSCTIAEYQHDRIAASCTLDRDGLIVFVEQQGKGWRATMDDQSVPIHPVNHVMRAVRAARGSHRVTLEYAVPGRTLGAAVSALGCLLVALAIWTGRRRD